LFAGCGHRTAVDSQQVRHAQSQRSTRIVTSDRIESPHIDCIETPGPRASSWTWHRRPACPVGGSHMPNQSKGGRTRQSNVAGSDLRELRRRCGKTQKELAIALELGKEGERIVARWEQGAARPADERLEDLVRALSEFGVSPDELLNAGFAAPLL